MRLTDIWTLENLMKCANSTQTEINGEWVPARPHGYPSIKVKLKAMWLVFMGKADVVIWPKDQ